MIESIEIKNFRCFESLSLKGLARINLLVGKNGSGKTAILESVFLGGGRSPEIVFRIRMWRGYETLQISSDREKYESVWRDLFYKFDQNRVAEISIVSSENKSRSVKISYNKSQAVTLPPGIQAANQFIANPIVFEYNNQDKKVFRLPVQFTPQGMVVGQAPIPGINMAFFASQQPIPVTQFTQQFSELSKAKRQGEIVEGLRSQFPFIEDLSVEVDAGVSSIYASVKTLPQKIPLSLLSSGINRLVCILIALIYTPKGAVVIDEIENGFYYETMGTVWKLISEFASKYDSQVFASTHSLECLQAAAKTLKPEDFTLIQTSRSNGGASAMIAQGSDAAAAIQQDVEVRR